MTTYKRKDLPALLQAIDKNQPSQIYLIFGERYLCQQAADEILLHLLPDEKQRASNLVLVDGTREEDGKTLSDLRTYSLFGGKRVVRVADSRLLISKAVAKTLWEKGAGKYQDNDLPGAARYLRQVLEIGGLTPADLLEISSVDWKSKLGFDRPRENLTWVGDVFAKTGFGDTAGDAPKKEDITVQYTKAFEDGLPSGNILVLVADAADKRKKLYKYIDSHGTVLDLSMDTGATKAAKDAQNEVVSNIVHKTLAGHNKKISPRALQIFLERIGFHPVAAALESEKLAMYSEDRAMITEADLNEVIGRTREEAVYELSEAFASRDLTTTLVINSRLLENGVHPLAIISTLRKHLKKMLLVCALRDLDSPAYTPGLSFPAFKDGYLKRIKDSRDLHKELPSHPYPLYMMFRNVEKFRTATLIDYLSALLESEYRLKSSGLQDKIILESMFFALLGHKGRSANR